MKKRVLSTLLAFAMILTTLPMTALAAADIHAGSDATLQSKIDGAASGDTIILDAGFEESVTIPTGKNLTLNINGKGLTNKAGQHTITVESGAQLTITGTGTIQNTSTGKAALYNSGTVTIQNGKLTRDDSSKWYVVYNAVGAKMTISGGEIISPDSGSSNVINHGTMTISGGIIDGAYISVKNDETGNLTVTGGTIKGYDQAIQNWHNATVEGGTMEGCVYTWAYQGLAGNTTITDKAVINGDIGAVQYYDGADATVAAKVAITGGTVNGKMVVGYSNYPSGQKPALTADLSIRGGIFSGDVSSYVADDYTTATVNGKTVVVLDPDGAAADTAVAEINGNLFDSYYNAMLAVQDGQTVKLLKPDNTHGKTYWGDYRGGGTITIDFGTNTFTGDNGNSAIRIVGSNATLQNGSIVTSNGTYCTLLVQDGKVLVKNMELQNSTQFGNSIKAFAGGHITLQDATVSSSTYGGGVEAAGGTVDIYDSTFSQVGFHDWNSMNVAASGGTGVVNIHGGTFASENYGLYIFSSGGTINVYGGSFQTTGDKAILKADIDNGSYPSGVSTINVYDGTFDGSKIEKTDSENAAINLYGGYYSSSFQKADLEKFVTEGYTVAEGNYTVDGKSYAYKVIEKPENTLVSVAAQSSVADEEVSATLEGTAIQLSGMVSGEITVTYTDAENVSKTFSVTHNGEAFEAKQDGNVITKVTVGETSYSIDISGLTLKPEKVEVTVGQTAAEVDTSKFDPEDTEALALATEAAEKLEEAGATSAVGLESAAAAEVEIKTDSNGTTVDGISHVTAAEKLNEALQQAGQPQVGTDAVTLVVQPYLDIKVVGAEYSDDGSTPIALTFDIKPMYQIVATTDPADIQLPGGGGTVNAAVVSEQPQEMTGLQQSVTVTLTVPDTFTLDADNTYVKHTKNGTLYGYYKAVVSGQKLTFTTDGFSDFEVRSDSRKAEVVFEDQILTYTLANVGDALPAYTGTLASNQRFNGWKFNGIGNTHKTLSETLFNALSSAYSDGGNVALTANADITTVEDNNGDDGGSVTNYAVTVADSANGSATVDRTLASPGNIVTITPKPNSGYRVDKVTVQTAKGTELSVTKNSDGTYKFKIPYSKVTVTVTFTKGDSETDALPFTDVKENQWFQEAVAFVYENGMMNGISDTLFAPDTTLTRSMIAQVLYNRENKPSASGNAFTDVTSGTWYADAINWAATNEIVTGYGNGLFGPDDNITREQMALILYNYAKFKGYDITQGGMEIREFSDYESISSWATEAMTWAVNAGVLNGRDNGTLDPAGTATRAEVAQILMNFCDNVVK